MGVPPKSVIVTALRSDGERHPAKRARKSWLGSLATVPGAVAAFLPTFTCPACWPAYAAVLSAAGIGFLGNEKYLLPVTVVLLTATVGALAYAARRRRRYGPLLLGAIGSVAILLAKFMFHIPSATYMAAGLILVASVWNAWAGRPKADSCPSCATERP